MQVWWTYVLFLVGYSNRKIHANASADSFFSWYDNIKCRFGCHRVGRACCYSHTPRLTPLRWYVCACLCVCMCAMAARWHVRTWLCVFLAIVIFVSPGYTLCTDTHAHTGRPGVRAHACGLWKSVVEAMMTSSHTQIPGPPQTWLGWAFMLYCRLLQTMLQLLIISLKYRHPFHTHVSCMRTNPCQCM